MTQLRKTRSTGVVRLRRRRPVKWRARAPLLLAAGPSIAGVFVSGYAVGDHRRGGTLGNAVVGTLALRGTSVAFHARARLEVWRVRAGNWPMTLSVVGLPKLLPRTYYEVDSSAAAIRGSPLTP